MIIQCEQCKTRFKVADDKLQAGPIRVRCSKCNHVFMAQPDAGQGVVPSAPATVGAVPGMFASASVPPPSGAGGGFSSPQNRSGIFRAPTQTGMPGATAPPTSAPPMAASAMPARGADPFGLSATPAPFAAAPPQDPFAGLAPRGRSDSFGGVGAGRVPPPPGPPPPGPPPPGPPPPGPPPPGPGPITAVSMPAFNLTPTGQLPSAAPAPFGFGDPFTGRPSEQLTRPGLPRAATPGLAATESMSRSDLTAPTVKDPLAAAAAMVGDAFSAKPTIKDPFQSGSGAISDPFSIATGASTAPVADPFGLATSGPSMGAAPGGASLAAAFSAPPAPPSDGESFTDPFAGIDVDASLSGAMSDLTGAASAPAAPAQPPPPPEDGDDPFAGLDADAEGGGLFDAPVAAKAPAHGPAKESTASGVPAPAGSHAPPQTTPHAEAPRTTVPAMQSQGADLRRLRRMEAVQRAKELFWAAAQVALFAVLVLVAVVMGRGGDLSALVAGDLHRAFGGAPQVGKLVVSELRVARRVQANGVALAVISGVVTNAGLESVPGARIDVRFDPGKPAASGWAWSDINGLDVDQLRDAPDAAALSSRAPRAPSLAPGERAPFVVLAPAPTEGSRAAIAVVATAPPPPAEIAPAPPVPAAPVPAAPAKPAPVKPAPAKSAPPASKGAVPT